MNKKISLNQLLATMCGRDWDSRSVAFLLGAGCSITSGVPDANQLARKWLYELRKNDPAVLPGVTKENAAQNYFRVCDERWGKSGPSSLKIEISRFTQARNPGAGYIAFANILAHPRPSSKAILKTIITTNFDNLIEQAFQKYTNHFPVVIPDPTLVRFMEKSEDVNSPVTILKIHGDSRYVFRNSEESTAKISDEVFENLRSRMRAGVLIVLGYAGNEKGIAQLIGDLVVSESIDKVFWVSTDPPGKPILSTFEGRPECLIMVDHRDFDDFMLQWQERLSPLSYAPSSLAEMISFRHYDQLMWKLGLYGKTNQKPISLNPARFHDYFSVFAEMSKHIYGVDASVDVAEKALKHALDRYGTNVNLMVLAGSVFKSIIRNTSMYHDLVSSALELSPVHAGANAEMGVICRERKDLSGAIRHFRAAIENDPGDLNSHVNLCGCLLATGDISAGHDEYQQCSHNAYKPMHRLELAFYAYAREDFDKNEALNEILSNLERNISPDFDFSLNIASAPEDRQPLLNNIADVMNGRLDSCGVMEFIRKEIHQ